MKLLVLLYCFAILALTCSAAGAYTLTFDDVSTGQDLSYYRQLYGLSLVSGWEVLDSVASGWGTPKSGTQSVIWNGNSRLATGIDFSFADGVGEYAAQTVGAYFTTQPGVVVKMYAYSQNGLSSVTIGDTNGVWINHYAQIGTDAGGFASVHIDGISSPDARYHFSMDDLTIVPVPEPSSLAGLAIGLLPLGLTAKRSPKVDCG